MSTVDIILHLKNSENEIQHFGEQCHLSKTTEVLWPIYFLKLKALHAFHQYYKVYNVECYLSSNTDFVFWQSSIHKSANHYNMYICFADPVHLI